MQKSKKRKKVGFVNNPVAHITNDEWVQRALSRSREAYGRELTRTEKRNVKQKAELASWRANILKLFGKE